MRSPAFALWLVLMVGCPAGAAGPPLGGEGRPPVQEPADRPAAPANPDLRTVFGVAGLSTDGKLVATGHTLDRGRRVKYGRGSATGSAGTPLPGLLCIWDVQTGALRRAFDAHRLSVLKVRFLPDGRLLTGGSDGPFSTDGLAWRVWDVETGRRIHDMPMEFGLFFSEDVSRDGSVLVEQGPKAGSINLLDLRAGKRLRTIEGPAEASLAGVFAPDGDRLLFFGVVKGARKSATYRVDVGEGRFVGPFPAPILRDDRGPRGRLNSEPGRPGRALRAIHCQETGPDPDRRRTGFLITDWTDYTISCDRFDPARYPWYPCDPW